MTIKRTLLTLFGFFAFFGLVAIMLGSSTARTQETETKALVCQASFFFSFDRDEVIGTTARVNGRGLVSCKNDEGFSLEEPVVADLEVDVTGDLPEGEIALSGNTSAFVIPRDPAQMQDLYKSRDFAWTNATGEASERRMVFRGVANDLVIDLGLKSNDPAIMNLVGVKSLRLHFDDQAPDFTLE